MAAAKQTYPFFHGYPVLKCLSGFNFLRGGSTSSDLTAISFQRCMPTNESYLYMIVKSFGYVYAIKLYSDKMHIEIIDDLGTNAFNKIGDKDTITNPLLLSLYFSFLEIFWSDYYKIMKESNCVIYNFDYFINNYKTHQDLINCSEKKEKDYDYAYGHGRGYKIRDDCTYLLGIVTLAGAATVGDDKSEFFVTICNTQYRVILIRGESITFYPDDDPREDYDFYFQARALFYHMYKNIKHPNLKSVTDEEDKPS